MSHRPNDGDVALAMLFMVVIFTAVFYVVKTTVDILTPSDETKWER